MLPGQPRSRVRLETDVRRELLLRAGVELLASHPPGQISVADVARKAGISRGLLYHYFADRDAFVVAVVEQASEQLREALTSARVAASDDPVGEAIAAFIEFAEAHAAGFRAVVTGTDLNPALASVLERTRERDLDAFVEGIAATSGDAELARGSRVLRAALHAHMHFMEGAVARWLSRGEITREQLRELLIGALRGAVAAADAIEPLDRQRRRGRSSAADLDAG